MLETYQQRWCDINSYATLREATWERREVEVVHQGGREESSWLNCVLLSLLGPSFI
jgi:hypothetical protein